MSWLLLILVPVVFVYAAGAALVVVLSFAPLKYEDTAGLAGVAGFVRVVGFALTWPVIAVLAGRGLSRME